MPRPRHLCTAGWRSGFFRVHVERAVVGLALQYDGQVMEAAARPFVLASFGYRRLAARVITQALHDLHSSSVDDQKSAQTFLSGSDMLCFWCDLAEIQPAYVVARAATFVSSSRPAPRT
jgi:hypothetical protein